MGKSFYATGLSSRYIPLAEFMKVPSKWKSGPAFRRCGMPRRISALLFYSSCHALVVRLPSTPDSRTRVAKMKTSRGLFPEDYELYVKIAASHSEDLILTIKKKLFLSILYRRVMLVSINFSVMFGQCS